MLRTKAKSKSSLYIIDMPSCSKFPIISLFNLFLTYIFSLINKIEYLYKSNIFNIIFSVNLHFFVFIILMFFLCNNDFFIYIYLFLSMFSTSQKNKIKFKIQNCKHVLKEGLCFFKMKIKVYDVLLSTISIKSDIVSLVPNIWPSFVYSIPPYCLLAKS